MRLFTCFISFAERLYSAVCMIIGPSEWFLIKKKGGLVLMVEIVLGSSMQNQTNVSCSFIYKSSQYFLRVIKLTSKKRPGAVQNPPPQSTTIKYGKITKVKYLLLITTCKNLVLLLLFKSDLSFTS